MNKFVVNKFFLLLTLTASIKDGFCQSAYYDPNRLISADSLKADVTWLYAKLKNVHPALYRYSAPTVFDSAILDIRSKLNEALTENQFLSVLQSLNAYIKDGHTMFLPSDSAADFNLHSGYFFPFSVHFQNRRLYILQNGSTDNTVMAGDEIEKINGLSTTAILDSLLGKQIRDGYNKSYPIWILDHYFNAYYAFAMGQASSFQIECRNARGEIYTRKIQAESKAQIRLITQNRYPNCAPTGVTGMSLEQMPGKGIMLLKIGTFDSALISNLNKANYGDLLDSLFQVISTKRTRTVILDVRNNQGGEFQPARDLLCYLLHKPVRFLLNSKESCLLRLHKQYAFHGQLIVLINGGSFSATSIVAAILKATNRAVFVGIETGGNRWVISGDPEQFELPHSKIQAFISTVNYQISKGKNDGHGVMPNYSVVPSIKDLIACRDPVLAKALKLAKSGK